MSVEKHTTLTITDYSLSPSIKRYEKSNFCLIFQGNCLKQKNATFTPPNIINVFIVYELDTWSVDLNSDFTLKDYLFEGVKLGKILTQIDMNISACIIMGATVFYMLMLQRYINSKQRILK